MSRVLPILFNTDMVRAILDGRKTVTRRTIKKYIPNDAVFGYTIFTPDGYISCKEKYAERFYRLPFQKGDILYVRETYCPNYFDFVTQYGNKHGYKADYDVARLFSDISRPKKWTPSIHMPKEAVRIWLKVTDVRVERLQNISNEQILREGISRETVLRYMKQCPEETEEWERAAHIIPYSELWNSTIKKSDIGIYDWGSNPWVWVIAFERCEKPEERKNMHMQ